MARDAYFTTADGTWFTPTDLARGPWDVDSCHGGPPTALVLRALEGLGLPHRLTRVTVSLSRPVPMAGFAVEATTEHVGRTTATTSATIVDGDGSTCAMATALHIMPSPTPTVTAPIDVPVLAAAVPGGLAVHLDRHGGQRFFSHSVEVREDPQGELRAGQGVDSDSRPHGLGPATVWMQTVPIVAGERPSPLQRLGPLADSGNALSCNVPLEQLACVNPDLTLTVLREPVGSWFASRAATHTSDDGIGFSDAHLFDTEGLVGRVTQSLVLRAT